MKQQHWFCENCDSKGAVEYEQHEDIYSVYDKIRSQHKKNAPDCNSGLMLVRVINHEKDI